jgi:hypothetical protein
MVEVKQVYAKNIKDLRRMGNTLSSKNGNENQFLERIMAREKKVNPAVLHGILLHCNHSVSS